MKRYLLFTGYDYYPNRAWSDFKGDFDSVEDAIKSPKDKYDEWYQVVDLNEGKIVKEGDIYSLTRNE